VIHDRTTDGSQTVLAVNGAQWIASGFFAMCIATALAIVLTLARWPWRDRRRRRPDDDDWSEPARPVRSQRKPPFRNRTSALRE
jgi:hypothetical protein